MSIQIDEQALWRIRDLVHHFGVHHPTVMGTQAGSDIALIGVAIPALAKGEQSVVQGLGPVFERHGWGAQAITLESALDLADSLMLPPFDPAKRLAFRHSRQKY